jgi:AcrR family transcriptional regulator
MAPRGRSSLSARGRAKRTGTTARKSPVQIAPIYKRLPHGPHRLERNEVVLHQRARIHGAMVEAIAQHGYERTSVKQVIGLAGVSRRSFYEQFANKQECFLATFDLIVRRDVKQLRRAYLATEGTLEERARATFQSFAQATMEERNASVLVALEAQRAGPAGVMRLRKATSTCEQMLARSFAESPGAHPLPMSVVRGITGGLHGIASAFLRGGDDVQGLDLGEEMLRWTLLFQTPAAERMGEQLRARLSMRMREISATYGQRLSGAEAPSRDDRTRLLQGMLRLVTYEEYRNLSAPQIADEANVPIDRFCELFSSKDDCFLQALDMIADELLAIVADPGLVSDAWPQAVRRVLARLMDYLASHPLHARTLAQEAFFAGNEAFERNEELARSVATLLTEGAPAPAQGGVTVDAVSGAIWHTIRCQVAGGRIQLLAALPDDLAYVVLAPFIGADAAAAILTEEPQLATPATETLS